MNSLEVKARLQEVDKKVDQICKACGVPGASIGIMHQGEIVHKYNYGYSNLEKKVKTADNTIYGVGRLSHSFIAATVGLLVQEGHMTWNRPISEVMGSLQSSASVVPPDVPSYILDGVTATDLMCHRVGTSGSRAMSWASQGDGEVLIAKQNLLEVVNQFELFADARIVTRLNDWNYVLVGAAIEEATGETLAHFMNRKIFQLMKLEDTTFRPRDADQARLALPYTAMADGTPFLLEKPQSLAFEGTILEATGGMFSTVNDLLRYALNIIASIHDLPDKKCDIKQLPWTLVGHTPALVLITEASHALGWIRTQLPAPVGLLGISVQDNPPPLGASNKRILMLYHQGSTAGYHSHLALFPESHSAVVVLANSLGLSDAADWIARTYIEALFDFSPKHDYLALAQESNARSLRSWAQSLGQYEQLRSEWEVTQRMHDSRIAPIPDASEFVGRYVNASRLFCIEIVAAPESPCGLRLRFQGRASQEYEMRRLSYFTFDWAMTHDEAMRRGRYVFEGSAYYLLQFKLDDRSEVDRLEWRSSFDISGSSEIFKKQEHEHAATVDDVTRMMETLIAKIVPPRP